MENINLIRKIAWEFHYKTGITYEELFAEASLMYLEAKLKYDPSRCKEGLNPAKYSFYVWAYMHNELINFCKREMWIHRIDPKSIKELGTCPTPFFEMFDSIPDHCKPLVEMILNSPEEYATLKPKDARGVVVNQLRQQGWSWSKIWDSMRDLKKILNETPENCIIY